MFRLGEDREREGGRWAKAIAIAAALHVAVIAGVLAMPASPPAAPVEPSREVIFFRGLPKTAAPAQAAAPKVAPARRTRKVARVLPEVRPAAKAAPVAIPREEAAPEANAEVAVEPSEASGDQTVAEAGVEGGSSAGVPGGSANGVHTLGDVSRAPAVLAQIAPQYPRRARAEGLTGLVLLQVIVGADGQVEADSAKVLRSVPGLDEAAIAAVLRWRFAPALGRDGAPVRVRLEVPIQFRLR